MTVWIALLRGINVGGSHKLPMADLREMLTGLGFGAARTYIQSGNCVFESDDGPAEALTETIESAIAARFGFRPRTMVLSKDDFDASIAANPYAAAGEADPKSVHFYFLSEPARNADLSALDTVRKANEAFTLTDRVFYLHAPDGIGRSKLAEKAEKCLGVAATARNFRSVTSIAELAGS